MPQRICTRKPSLLKANTKRISKKNLKLSLNGSSLKLSTPANVISKVKQSESIEAKWKVPTKKIRNAGSFNVAQHSTRQKNFNASQIYGNDNSGSSAGK